MENHENMSDGKTVFLIAVVIGALVAIAVGVSIIASIASDSIEPQRSNQDVLATEARIAPVGKVNLASNPNPELGKAVAAAPAAAEFSADSAYNSTCAACHASGVMGAPVVGDAGAWKSRLAAGIDTVYSNAINGKGGMPPRGGSSLNDDQIKAIVDYMVK